MDLEPQGSCLRHLMDKLTAEQRSALMRQVRARDTRAELAVRSLVHRLGYRFRLHRNDLPGKPDLAFPSRRKAIFVHGCFWHGHDCRAGRNRPATNTSYWDGKLQKNMQRDRASLAALSAQGWTAMVVWECELKDCEGLAHRVSRFLNQPSQSESRL
jgi:DNA mismatch endonuclease, patch repair protein